MTHRLGALAVICALILGCQTQQPTPRVTAETAPKPVESVALPKPQGDGLPLLKEIMDAYHEARSFQATSTFRLLGNNDPKDTSSMERLILVQNPNRYRVTCSIGGIKVVSVCDGSKGMEYSNTTAEIFDAPSSIATANAQVIGTFSMGASLLYRFFSGSEFVDEVVNVEQSPVRLKPGANPNEAILSFYAIDPWGETELTVNKNTKMVLKIQSQMNAAVRASQESVEREYRLDSLVATETFRNAQFNKPIDAEAFKLIPPAGVKPTDLTSKAGSGALKPGSPAPDFEVQDMSGKKVTLKSLRDSVVMIDFWATWCNPCRRGLPDTTEIYLKYKDKGLAVLAISDEDTELIKQFMIESNLSKLPAFHDPNGDTGKKYQVTSIPTVVIIDRRGGISEILVGLHEKNDILKALRRAGLQL